MLYHLIIDSSNSFLDFRDNEEYVSRQPKKIIPFEVLFLNDEKAAAPISIIQRPAFGSNLYINSLN